MPIILQKWWNILSLKNQYLAGVIAAEDAKNNRLLLEIVYDVDYDIIEEGDYSKGILDYYHFYMDELRRYDKQSS